MAAQVDPVARLAQNAEEKVGMILEKMQPNHSPFANAVGAVSCGIPIRQIQSSRVSGGSVYSIAE